MEVAGLSEEEVRIEYTGGDRGWKGDVPIVRLNTDRIQSLGWTCRRTSRQALSEAMHAMLQDVRLGRL
jgi:UDP-glucose 4-epimerase